MLESFEDYIDRVNVAILKARHDEWQPKLDSLQVSPLDCLAFPYHSTFARTSLAPILPLRSMQSDALVYKYYQQITKVLKQPEDEENYIVSCYYHAIQDCFGMFNDDDKLFFPHETSYDNEHIEYDCPDAPAPIYMRVMKKIHLMTDMYKHFTFKGFLPSALQLNTHHHVSDFISFKLEHGKYVTGLNITRHYYKMHLNVRMQRNCLIVRKFKMDFFEDDTCKPVSKLRLVRV